MDYVVFGTGYGATLMLLGWALRTFGPVLRYRQDTDAPLAGDMLMARLSWRRFASALGAVVATSGIALILITFVIIFINPGDVVGSRIAWACFALILLAIAAWMWVYVGRFGIYGLLPERQKPAEVFRTPSPVRAIAARSVEATAASIPVVGVAESHLDTGDDEHGFDEPWFEEDEYGDEEESRYAKYQLHHPDEMDETEAYDEVTVAEEDEPVAEMDVDAGADVAASSDDVSVHEPQEVPGDEVAVNSDELIDTPEDVSGSTAVDHAAVEPDIEEVQEEEAEAGAEEEAAGFDEDMRQDDQPLSDTPEGRAEALRRIQAWQPEVSSEEDDS